MENNSALHIKTVITGVIAALTAFWGWFGWLVIIWVGLMLADWLVGSAVARQGGPLVQRQAPGGSLAQGRYDRHCMRGAGGRLAYWHDDEKPARYRAAIYVYSTDRAIGDRMVRHWGTGQSGGARRPHGRAGPGMAAENPGRWQVRRGCRR